MAIEAYKIYIEIVTEAPLGPLNDLLRTMAQVQKAQQEIQTGLNDMASGLRGTTRMAENLARAMQSVAKATKEAAASSRGIGAGGGGTAMPAANRGSGTTYSDPSRTAAAPTAQLLLTGPRQAPLALPYYPNTSRTDVTGRTPWPGPSNGFSLSGPAYGPSNALVPVGPRMDHSDVLGASPNRGSLVPISGGAGGSGGRGGNYGPGVPSGDPYQPEHGGLPTVYVPPPEGREAPDARFTPRPTLNPNPPKGGHGVNPMHIVAGVATTAFAGEMIYQTVKTLMDPSFQVSQEAIRVAAETRQSPDDVQNVIRAAFDQQRAVPGTNVVGNLEAFRMLFSLTQNQGEAETLLPAFLKVGTALQSFSPDAGSYDQQLEGVFKSAEFMGAVSKTDPTTGKTSVDATGAQKVANMLLAFETVSNGAVDPNKFLAFLRAGGTAAANMDPAQIPYLLPVIQSLNPRGAGQGLKSFEQQFSSGKMSQGVLEMLTEMGIVKNPGDVRKIGIGQFMLKPGALDEKVVMQAITDPIDFYNQTLLPSVDKYLTKEYGKTFTGADFKDKHILESQVLQQVSSRIPGGTLLGELLRTAPLSARDAQAVSKSEAFNLTGTLNQSPITQVAAFTGALNALLSVFAAPALKGALGGMNEITAAMNALTRAGQDHGGPAATAVSIGSGAAAHAAEGAIVAGTIALLGKGLSAVGFSTAGSVAGVVAKTAIKGSLWGTISLAAAQAAEAATEGLVNKYDPNFGRGADKSVGILSALDKWAFKLTGDPFFNVAGGSSAPRGAPPAPIATKTNPLPVVVTNGKDLMQSVDDHTAKQMSAPPTGQTGASFGASPAWAGRPGFSP